MPILGLAATSVGIFDLGFYELSPSRATIGPGCFSQLNRRVDHGKKTGNTFLKARRMQLCELIDRLSELRGASEPAELVRMALLICNRNQDLSRFDQPAVLQREYREITLQLQAATDQHGAVAEELDALASTEPCHFSPDHLWTLIRAIKVQNHILHMYLGPADVLADN